MERINEIFVSMKENELITSSFVRWHSIIRTTFFKLFFVNVFFYLSRRKSMHRSSNKTLRHSIAFVMQFNLLLFFFIIS